MTHHITDEQIDEATKDIGLQSPFARYRIARAILALAAPAPAVPSDERAAFEAWARPHGYDLRRNDVLGHYSSLDTLRAWEGWRARAALTAAPTPPAQAAVPEDVARDAKRYRWLRDMASQDWLHRNHNYQNLRGAAFDAAIDAARAAGGAA